MRRVAHLSRSALSNTSIDPPTMTRAPSGARRKLGGAIPGIVSKTLSPAGGPFRHPGSRDVVSPRTCFAPLQYLPRKSRAPHPVGAPAGLRLIGTAGMPIT